MFLDALASSLNRSIFRYKGPLDYLSSRGVSEEEIKKYKIGFSRIVGVPDDGSEERARFMEESWKGRKFENSIVFPVMNSLGYVIGLIGRSLDTKIFKVFVTEKAKHDGFFLGLYHALPYIYKSGRVFVVEGAFDWLALSKVLPNTVSSVTAGIYPNQYNLLRWYCGNIVTVFDSDEAGRYAADMASRKSGVLDMKLGYKDPAKCFESLGFNQFNRVIHNKVKNLPPVWM
ncbi:MAG TPA: toprim domain-containing protein, partial [Desulfohalobiaceae bacterium]|nr:toprim domain-containing protein [Desulfohalobiaceae bacterium]